MKIVLDTNIYVSALLSGGKSQAVIDRGRAEADAIFGSTEILEELFAVLLRRKFALPYDVVYRYVKCLEKIVSPVKLGDYPKVCRDADDDKILACAAICQADFIITGDDDLLVLKEYHTTKICTAAEYLDLIEAENFTDSKPPLPNKEPKVC
ncbi:MAG: putative toxin-antitoxin system toxin component, PIN family [Thermoguttaceae bacterium]